MKNNDVFIEEVNYKSGNYTFQESVFSKQTWIKEFRVLGQYNYKKQINVLAIQALPTRRG